MRNILLVESSGLPKDVVTSIIREHPEGKFIVSSDTNAEIFSVVGKVDAVVGLPRRSVIPELFSKVHSLTRPH